LNYRHKANMQFIALKVT